jgi:hypothetical protein
MLGYSIIILSPNKTEKANKEATCGRTLTLTIKQQVYKKPTARISIKPWDESESSELDTPVND